MSISNGATKFKKRDANDFAREHGLEALALECDRRTAAAESIPCGPIPPDDFATDGGESDTDGTAAPVALTPRDLLSYNVQDDPNALFNNRYLSRGGSLFLVGSTGAGKSSFAMQAAMCWALGESLFGIKPVRPLKSLFLQAENDDGDLSEMFRGVVNGLNLAGRLDEIEPMLRFVSESATCGDDFAPWAENLIRLHKPDLVFIDPLFAFIGGNVSDQATASKFLRNGLGAISQRTGVAWVVVHHTNKPPKDPKPGTGVGSDFAYLGSGSAELANWARAVLTIRETEDGLFELRAAKRGRRAGLIDSEGQPATEVFMAHGARGICWERASGSVPATPKSIDEGIVEDVLEALKTPPSGGWHAEEIEQKIVDIKGGTVSGAKTFFYRKVKSRLNKPINGIYTIRVSKFHALSKSSA